MTEVLNRETGELTEIADEETLIVSEMTPDTGDEPEPEPEPEPEDEPEAPPPLPPQTGPAPADVEQRFKKLDTSTLTYTKRVAELLDWMVPELNLCPLCSPTPHLGFINLGAAGQVPQEVIDPVQMYLGFAREIEYVQDTEVSQCLRCKGEGKVATGSKVKTAAVKVCPVCKGFGCTPPPADDPLTAPAELPALAPVTAAVVPVSDADRDPTGEPRILPDGQPNPNFGKWPQFKVPVAPWGMTAGLTAQDTTP